MDSRCQFALGTNLETLCVSNDYCSKFIFVNDEKCPLNGSKIIDLLSMMKFSSPSAMTCVLAMQQH